MLVFWSVTLVLSLIGGVIYYLFIKDSGLPFAYKKAIVLSIISLSFAIPLGIQNQSFFLQRAIAYSPSDTATEYVVLESVYDDFCPSGIELEHCYELALGEDKFCNCTEVSKENLITYCEIPTYNFVIESSTWISMLSLIVASLIFLVLALRIAYLYYIVYISEKESLRIDGKAYTILRNKKTYSVASFQLLTKNYILWQKEMDFLSEEEKKAILWHEIGHIRQKDTWVKIMLDGLQTIWFMNPMLYFFKNELDRISEFSADEFAVTKTGDLKLYATVLVSMKRYQNLAMAQALQGNSLLKERIEYLLKGKISKQKNSLILPYLLLILFLNILVAEYSLPFFETQYNKIEFYKTLSKASEDTGKLYFCKGCKSWETAH